MMRVSQNKIESIDSNDLKNEAPQNQLDSQDIWIFQASGELISQALIPAEKLHFRVIGEKKRVMIGANNYVLMGSLISNI